MSYSSSSSSSSSKSDGFGSEPVGSSLPPPPLLPSPPPPILESEPKITMVSLSPCWEIEGSSISSITSTRPYSVARTTSSTDDTKIPVGVVFGFRDVYGRCCMLGISLTSLAN